MNVPYFDIIIERSKWEDEDQKMEREGKETNG